MQVKQSCTMFADCARQPAPTYHPDHACRSPVSIIMQQTKPPPCAAVCPLKLHPLDVCIPRRRRTTKKVSGTPACRTNAQCGIYDSQSGQTASQLQRSWPNG
jgi:hypothetical protein